MYKYIGIDISKQTFDVFFSNNKHQVFNNSKQGFKSLLRIIDPQDRVVMEASGPYYLQLATFLYQNDIEVYVENPLKIKRFSQMNFNRSKTDKKDSQVIRDYAYTMSDKMNKWEPDSKYIIELRELNSAIQLINKEINQTQMQLEAFQSSGHINKEVIKSLKSLYKSLSKHKEKLESEMERIGMDQYQDNLLRLTSIPGIGIKTATMLIAISGNFEKFEHYKQLIAYIGFSPRVYQSGTSINGKGHICKMGNPQMRKLLYLCSWSAKTKNTACIEMYERLKAMGKPEKVIKVAIANKLIKQCFAVVKNKTFYEQNYI